MEISLSPKSTSDPLGRYYTKNIVGHILAREMGLENPKIVMDLGTGDGALSIEASRIWTNAQFVTVDIDSNISSHQSISNRYHHTFDVLNSQLHAHIGLDLGTVDGAICNPPYIRPHWRKDFAEILEDAGLSGIFHSVRDVGADVLFIAQNLRFLKNGGRLGLILPDGLIAGEKYTNFRKLLLTKHTVERVIELPRRIFHKTDAKAHIVIVTKQGQPNENITVQRLNEDGSLSTNILVEWEKAIQRMDYSYLESQSSFMMPAKIRLKEVCEILTRGQLSSTEVKKSNIKIFHSTDFPEIIGNNWPEVSNTHILKKNATAGIKTAIAEAGDILLCRVGRNLEIKVCYLSKGYVAISDCVYRLKVTSQSRDRVMDFLIGPNGKAQLKALAHGVGAKYLSKRDLLQLIIDNGSEDIIGKVDISQ